MRNIIPTNWATLGAVSAWTIGVVCGGCVGADETTSMRGRSAYETRHYYVTDSFDRTAPGSTDPHKAAADSAAAGGTASSTAAGSPTGAAAPDDSIERGESLRHVPTDCERTAYADIKGLAAAEPVRANLALLATRGEVLLDRYAAAHAAGIRDAASVLKDRGIDWQRDVNDAAVCMNGPKVDVLVVAGSFGNRDVLGAIAEAGRKAGEPTSRFEEGGHDWVKVGPEYVTLARRGVLLVGADRSHVESGRSSAPDLVSRGGTTGDLVFYQGPRPNDRKVSFALRPIGDDSYLARTTVSLTSGSFDPDKDRQAMRDRIDRLTHDVESTPLAPLASAIGRTEIVIHADQLTMRTILPKEPLTEAVKNAAGATRNDWGAVAELLPPVPLPGGTAIGGGPPPAATAPTTPASDESKATPATGETNASPEEDHATEQPPGGSEAHPNDQEHAAPSEPASPSPDDAGTGDVDGGAPSGDGGT